MYTGGARSSEAPPLGQTSIPGGGGGGGATTMPNESNPYVSPSPVPVSSAKSEFDVLCCNLIRDDGFGEGCAWKMGEGGCEATKKGQDYAGDVWQHLKTGPSLADAAVGRIAQGTKVLAEGGYEKIFRTTFETVPDENS
ncbi:hypothetical protein OSB04_005742 [Centaurea solstitialis]|uniref:Uncharacterized protein n=1 Tax=Centaurea solstitialis TaxID=347529 RepID=A0AA38WH27_9ASTR|nr:hypothetical protein OSB04_005742 [Centaurea solstitialis]